MAATRRHLGLKARMALSYLLATVGIVLFVELLVTRVIDRQLDSGTDVSAAALQTAGALAKTAVRPGGTLQEGQALGDTHTTAVPGQTRVVGGAVVVPVIGQDLGAKQPVSTAILVDAAGVVSASSYPARFPVGAPASDVVATDAANTLHKAIDAHDPALSIAALSFRESARVVWSIVAVPSATKGAPPIGFAYVETPATVAGHPFRVSTVAVVVALTVPVGVAFGLLSTRNLRRRLRALTGASTLVAAGDFTPRVEPASPDELGQLERNFNEMAERLSAATDHERALAAQNARLAERTRISRELHDSLSQDLFSLNLLVGGLQQALPADSALQPRVQRVQETVVTAVHELRALLLDLHPTVLSERGLVPALQELCASYRTRLGMDIAADLTPVQLDPAAEHALVRVAQECLANAAKHADARRVTVRLHQGAAGVELVIRDDGSGFDPAAADERGLGLRLMRERVGELGGTVAISSAPGQGAEVRVDVPAAVSSATVAPARPSELVP